MAPASVETRRTSARSRRAEASEIDPALAERVAETFHALGDPTRVRIVSALADGEVPVGEIARGLSMSPSAVSHQLALLRRLHIVRARRAGRRVLYRLDDDHVRVLLQMGLDHVRHRRAEGDR